MQRGQNRLLMLLITAAIAGCAGQTERSNSGTGGTEALEYERVTGTSNVVTKEELERRAAAEAAAASAPAAEQASSGYEPQQEEVQYIDRPLDETPAPVAAAAAPTASAADEALPDFPITKYEIEEQPAEQAAEVEDLGEQADDAVTTTGAAEDSAATDSGISEPTIYPDEPEQAEAAAEVEDLGTQPDESGTVSHGEESLAAQGSGISEPTTYPDEPVQQAAATVTVSFEAEPLFSFDRFAIREDQRTALNEFVAGLKDVDYSEIVAVGHADRIGTEDYNLGLSEKRANAVKDYLVGRGIPAARIRVEGRGELEPVTADGCKTGKRKAIIACLQPDRRVDVSVNGSKKN